MAADVRYTIREAMRNKELVVHYRQNLESNHRQCKFPQLTALFHPNKSCQRRNQTDKQGFKSPTRSEFGTKRSQVQILSPRPKGQRPGSSPGRCFYAFEARKPLFYGFFQGFMAPSGAKTGPLRFKARSRFSRFSRFSRIRAVVILW